MKARTGAPTGLSVVITNYNYRDFVVEAVHSALNQSRPALQVIVVDDGSQDGSEELLRTTFSGDPRVTLISGPNGGQLSAFQRGVDQVSGEVVCFLDADDRWSPDYLEKVGQLFDGRPDVDMVFSDVRLFGQESGTVAFDRRAVDLGYTAISTYLEPHWYGAPTSALSVRVPMARRCLDLPEGMLETWRICADNVLVFGTSLLCGRKFFLPTGGVEYRIHGKNGWGLQPSPARSFLVAQRSRALIAFFAKQMGIDATCWPLLKAEFLTKPLPTKAETRRYARLAMNAANVPYLTRLEKSLSIRRWGWRSRRDTRL